MANPNLTDTQIRALGEQIYRERIRPTLTDADIGKFVTIDLNTGDYEIDDDDITGDLLLTQRRPDAFCYGRRVGYTAAYFLGGHYEEPEL